MLHSHPETLQLLGSAVEKLAAAKDEIKRLQTAGYTGDRLGAPEKKAGDKSAQAGLPRRSVVVGARTSEKKASDNAMARGLGLDALVDPNAD